MCSVGICLFGLCNIKIINMKEYLKQVKNIKIITDKTPRVYLQWNNTEDGRDKIEQYERIDKNGVRYVNIHNPAMIVYTGKFFEVLEEMFNRR